MKYSPTITEMLMQYQIK